MNRAHRKARGAYYTPPDVAATLVRWVVRDGCEHLLDPSCGDGRFLSLHPHSTGVDCDEAAIAAAAQTAPEAQVHCADFFDWAATTPPRFDCAVGNPPFIRYQRFSGSTRQRALDLCAALGVRLSGLSSSWVPYLIATASLLRPSGRMAFVVPAEIGHAPYAAPLLAWLVQRFADVRIVAIRRKVFAELSEDVWLLYADGFGGRTSHFGFADVECFNFRSTPPEAMMKVSVSEWQSWRCRLRPMLLPERIRSAYRALLHSPDSLVLGECATVGIGYVSGANDFFHLRPSQARHLGVPDTHLRPTVRRGRDLQGPAITAETVEHWRRRDAPNFLLALDARTPVPEPVRHHLDSAAGRAVRQRYKCRVRKPWYVVPNVVVPDLFLTYMSSAMPVLVANRAECTCTNTVHAVRLFDGISPVQLQSLWNTALTALSCEIEGHPLGGGVLKLEPREALRVAVSRTEHLPSATETILREGTDLLRSWRHHG